MGDHDFVSGLEDDGYYTPTIRRHSLEKIRLHNYYVPGINAPLDDVVGPMVKRRVVVTV